MNKLDEFRAGFLASLNNATRIAITTHVNPDGDGFCAALALQYFLRSRHQASSIIIDPHTDLSRYQFLIAGSNIEDYQPRQQKLDLLIVLDCNSIDRLGERAALIDSAASTIVIDHHLGERHPIPAKLSFIDPAYASVGAILFDFLAVDISALAPESRIQFANCIYITILNDTNNFINANTDATTFRIAAQLHDLGINPHQLYQQFFLNHTPEEMRYVGQTLATIRLHLNRQVLMMHSSLSMSQENGIDPESVMSVTRWVQGVAGVAVIAYLCETAFETYKISLRSSRVDVNKIAIKYGGGGHRSASGCTMHGTLETIAAQLLADLEAAL